MTSESKIDYVTDEERALLYDAGVILPAIVDRSPSMGAPGVVRVQIIPLLGPQVALLRVVRVGSEVWLKDRRIFQEMLDQHVPEHTWAGALFTGNVLDVQDSTRSTVYWLRYRKLLIRIVQAVRDDSWTEDLRLTWEAMQAVYAERCQSISLEE